VKNPKIYNNSTTTKAREKITAILKPSKFNIIWLKLKTSKFYLKKIARMTTKLFDIFLQISYKKKSIQAGIEPAIFCSVGRRVIHCATGPDYDLALKCHL
jgi:hypothetical protein